jgi:exopolysaccharide production protein ExoQ
VLLAFGLLGFVPFVVMILHAVLRGVRLHRAAPDGSWLWPNVLIAMLLVMNATESIFYTPRSFLFILFMTSIVMISIRSPDFYGRLQPPGSAGAEPRLARP